jgi:hypothetical protein
MKSGKAPGTDNIIPEVLKVHIETSVDMLHPLFERIWQEEKVRKEWREGITVKKGDTTNCNNWRGVTLLSVPSKILSIIILNRIKNVELRFRKEQAGFREQGSCVNFINTLRIILEQSNEDRTHYA